MAMAGAAGGSIGADQVNIIHTVVHEYSRVNRDEKKTIYGEMAKRTSKINTKPLRATTTTKQQKTKNQRRKIKKKKKRDELRHLLRLSGRTFGSVRSVEFRHTKPKRRDYKKKKRKV